MTPLWPSELTAWGLLRDCARRGMRAPVLAVGDGALGFWSALREVFPVVRQQNGVRLNVQTCVRPQRRFQSFDESSHGVKPHQQELLAAVQYHAERSTLSMAEFPKSANYRSQDLVGHPARLRFPAVVAEVVSRWC